MAKTVTKPAKGKNTQQQYDDSNRGVLFINDKDGNENRPDFTGKLTVNPEDYTPDDNGMITIRLAAWNKTSAKVGEYLSISASEQQSN